MWTKLLSCRQQHSLHEDLDLCPWALSLDSLDSLDSGLATEQLCKCRSGSMG